MRYNYCPKCGNKLTLKPAGDDGLVPYCEKCSKFWFDSFGSCVIIMVINELEEVAMLRQQYMSSEYKNFVSGYITVGETAEQAAFREVQEELGIALDDLEYSGTWWFAEEELLMHGYIGRATKKDFNLSKEVDSAEWIPLAELTEHMYPDSPGNAQYGTYRVYIERYSAHGAAE